MDAFRTIHALLTIGLFLLTTTVAALPTYGNHQLLSPQDSNLLDTIITEQERRLYSTLLERLLDRSASLEDEDIDDETSDLSSRISNFLESRKLPDARVMDKRKVFWQPLGYVPASMRMTPHSSKNSHKVQDGNRKGFRYGK